MAAGYLSAQLGQTGLHETNVVLRGLVLLSAVHFRLNVLDLIENTHFVD